MRARNAARFATLKARTPPLVLMPDDPDWTPCAVDDLPSVLNPVQAATLREILGATVPRRRLNVALSYAWDHPDVTELLIAMDLAPNRGRSLALNAARTCMTRWLRRENAMPLGIGFRMEKVFGVPAMLLCESYVTASRDDVVVDEGGLFDG